MYVGQLRRVGKIWKYTSVGDACPFGFARAAVGERSAALSLRPR